MKKIFTFIAAAMLTAAVNAQTWKVIDTTKDGKLAQNSELANNEYATVTVANQDGVVEQILDESGSAQTVEIGSYTFAYLTYVRVNAAPDATNPTGEVSETEGRIAIQAVAKKNADITFYYRIASSKSFDCYDQTSGAAVAVKQETKSEDGENLYVAGTVQMQKDHTYTFYIKGGTVSMYAFDLAEGTYVAPSTTFYANATAATVDGFSTITYSDGAKVALTGNSGKSFGGGKNLTINGSSYKGTKVSNGAQNTFYAPEGKKVYTFTIYSSVNKTEKTARPCYWKEVGGVSYSLDGADGTTVTTEMESYTSTTPDVYTYTFPEGLSEVTFTNAGEQNWFVIEASYDASDAKSVKAVEAAASSNAIKGIKAGKIVIVKNGAEYNVAGAQIK